MNNFPQEPSEESARRHEPLQIQLAHDADGDAKAGNVGDRAGGQVQLIRAFLEQKGNLRGKAALKGLQRLWQKVLISLVNGGEAIDKRHHVGEPHLSLPHRRPYALRGLGYEHSDRKRFEVAKDVSLHVCGESSDFTAKRGGLFNVCL